MGRIINSIKHGSFKIKIFLGIVIFLFIVAVGVGIVGLLTKSIILGGISCGFIVIDIILLFTVSLEAKRDNFEEDDRPSYEYLHASQISSESDSQDDNSDSSKDDNTGLPVTVIPEVIITEENNTPVSDVIQTETIPASAVIQTETIPASALQTITQEQSIIQNPAVINEQTVMNRIKSNVKEEPLSEAELMKSSDTGEQGPSSLAAIKRRFRQQNGLSVDSNNDDITLESIEREIEQIGIRPLADMAGGATLISSNQNPPPFIPAREQQSDYTKYKKPAELRMTGARSEKQIEIIKQAEEVRNTAKKQAVREREEIVKNAKQEAERKRSEISRDNIRSKTSDAKEKYFIRKSDKFTQNESNSLVKKNIVQPEVKKTEIDDSEKQGAYYEQYDNDSIKKLFQVMKTGKNKTAIIIDYCPSLEISRCPAFAWVQKEMVSMLLLETTPRTVTIPLSDFVNVSYKRKVEEKSIEAYRELEASGSLYTMFENVMPTYSTSIAYGRMVYHKNQYILGKDIAITPTSMRELMKKFNFKMSIFNSIADVGDYSDYFKEAFEAKTLWTDLVISQKEYQNRIRNVLQRITEDETVIKYDFDEDLKKMIYYRLITDEYADYYRNKRELLTANKSKIKR